MKVYLVSSLWSDVKVVRKVLVIYAVYVKGRRENTVKDNLKQPPDYQF